MVVLEGLRYRYGTDGDRGNRGNRGDHGRMQDDDRASVAELRFPDFSLPADGHLLLRGASGSGKSTLLALMAGLLTPTGGRLTVGGVEVGALAPAARDAWRGAHLGFVPQRLHLSPSLSVRDNLSLPYVAAGLAPDAARIHALLDELGIAALQDRRPHALSQGQAQRVALARALLRAPRLVLADEPTANLDDEACAATLALLRRAAAEHGVCLIIASHDARIEAAWADWPALHRLRLPGRSAVPSSTAWVSTSTSTA
ncbi:ABC transporter ATP-binding protein [Roseateles sp. L2-2]|uniref:ABC transporter ATP-binding protein n=1 Tax=Roseateles sp. L2-2 TaxID=3422597 RepID=UPI003D363C75